MMSGRQRSGSMRFRCPGSRTASANVDSRYPYLEREQGAAALGISNGQRVDGFERRLEVHRAFGGTRWRDLMRGNRRESAERELVRLVTVAHRELVRRDRIGRGRLRQSIDCRGFVYGWQIQDAFARALNVRRRLRAGAEPEHAAAAEPPGG